MFRRFQQRFVNPRVFRRTFLSAAHDTEFRFLVQPVITAGAIFSVLYVTAYYQNIQYNAYKDPHYPPSTIAPTCRELPEWQQAGCVDDEYYSVTKGAIFSTDFSAVTAPAAIVGNKSDIAGVIRDNPEIWTKYRKQATSSGVSFLKCVKPGFDDKSPGSGIRAGDQESYTTFSEVFDQVLSKRNKLYAADSFQPASDFDENKIDAARMDESGKYVKSTRVSASRSISGYLLTPALSFDDRRGVEKVLSKGLESMGGEYHPLFGSRSIRAKPHGMSRETENELNSTGNLFAVPTCITQLSAGLGRHWPDARGLYANEEKNLFAKVNCTEHVQIIAEEKGDNIQAAASRLSNALSSVESSLKSAGHEFARSDHLGYVNSNPDRLGSGLNVEVEMCIPNLSSHPKFTALASKLDFSYSGTGDNLKITNTTSYGETEVDIVNGMAGTAGLLVKLERALEGGETIDGHIIFRI